VNPRRRLLLAGSGAAATTLLAGCSSALPTLNRAVGAYPFTLGVASGYPTATGIVLWTRLAPQEDGHLGTRTAATLSRASGAVAASDPADDGPQSALPASVRVDWELARDEGMRAIVAAGQVESSAASAYSVHIDVEGLEPGRWYWYRFSALGHRSRLGRTRTLPAEGNALGSLRLAVASCQNHEHGFYAAYRHMLADEPDLIVHLGDYIYEVTWGRNLVRPLGEPEVQDLAQYRARHALYKRDPDLQTAHAMFPWVMVWDDHEVANDYAGASAERITPPATFLKRRAAAYRAYYEHMPLPQRMVPSGPDMRIHTSLSIGNLATLYLLDHRQYRSPQACPPKGRAGATTVVRGQCEALQDPARSVLGSIQEQWLDRELGRSAARWNLIAQQTLMAPLTLPGHEGAPSRLRTDGWDGYPVSRQRVLDSMARPGVQNPVVLGGDLHAFYAADLHRHPGAPSPVIASEFVGTSITSQAAEQSYYDSLKAANPHIHHANGSQRGYLRLTLTRERLEADLMGLADVTTPESAIARQAAFIVADGRPGPQAA
jgi:alkaline phosphatase D